MFGWFKKKPPASNKPSPVIGPPPAIGPPKDSSPVIGPPPEAGPAPKPIASAAKPAAPPQPKSAPAATGAAANAPRKKGPDFSPIDSQAKAEHFFKQGKLEKLLLMPEMFGGEDVPLNTIYVPLGVAAVKASFEENVITPLAEEGLLNQYSAKPEYHGNSVIPIAIQVNATGEREVSTTINIWGPALDR